MNRLTVGNREEVQTGTQIQRAKAGRQATNTGRFIEERPQTGRNDLQHIVGLMRQRGTRRGESGEWQRW